MDWFLDSSPTVLVTVASCVLIYFAMVVLSRIAGLRTFAKMSTFDFAVTIATGSIIANVVTSATTVMTGVVSLICLIGLQILMAIGKRRSLSVVQTLSNTPLLLMDGPKILYHNLAKGNVAESDLRAKLREANVLRLSQVQAVVLETTGDVSVLHTDKADLQIEEWIMEDVRKN